MHSDREEVRRFRFTILRNKLLIARPPPRRQGLSKCSPILEAPSVGVLRHFLGGRRLPFHLSPRTFVSIKIGSFLYPSKHRLLQPRGQLWKSGLGEQHVLAPQASI